MQRVNTVECLIVWYKIWCGLQYIWISVYIGSSWSSCNEIFWLTKHCVSRFWETKPKQRFVFIHHAVPLSLPQSLQTVWIQKIVQRFAGPDQGQISLPRVYLVSRYQTLREMRTTHWVYSYISKKRKFQTSTTNLIFLQDACSAQFHQCVISITTALACEKERHSPDYPSK